VTGRISILLVEDNIDDVEVLRRFIRRLPESYHIDIAYTGGEATEKAARTRYDLALVYQNLPDVSGRALIEHLRATLPELPIIMLTGHGDEKLAVEVMKAGAYDYLRKHDLSAAALGRAIHNVVERARLETEVRRANERLREWAIRDGLTGLYNHRHFQQLLLREWARAARYGHPLACLMIDLDHFKVVNDTYGHPFGDEVLKQVASTLAAEARAVDIVARYGGEEFVVVLPNTEVEGARHVADRIWRAVREQPVDHDGTSVKITLSVGVATSSSPGVDNEHALIKQADAALYRAKRAGRDQVFVVGDTQKLLTLAPQTTSPALYSPEVRRLFVQSMTAVLNLSEDSNDQHRSHSRRVAEIATRFGQVLGLTEERVTVLSTGALLHDIGRVAVSDLIWMKPGPLDPLEQEKTRLHAELGAEVVASTGILEEEALIVRHHHEHWDGSGYPDGLAGESIPYLARVVSIADGFEALTSERVWRPARSVPEALEIMRSAAGRVYEPELLDRFSEWARERWAPEEAGT
jgi:diguanylate cyclase (GGDEF)-like protein/putative nucleotidyltransferase with HDIG domain